MLRLLDAIEIITGLTASTGRRRALREQMEWIAELAARTIESPHDRTRFEQRLARVRNAFETEPVLFTAGKKGENRNLLKLHLIRLILRALTLWVFTPFIFPRPQS